MQPKQRQQLVKILGMLSSTFSGERATAAEMADKLVKTMGLTWEQVVAKPNGANKGRGDDGLWPHQRAAADVWAETASRWEETYEAKYHQKDADASPLRNPRTGHRLEEWHTRAEEFLALHALLNPWEKEFLTSIATQRYQPTSRQDYYLRRIERKLKEKVA